MNKEKPVYQGEIIELEITSVGRKGDGVGKHEEFTIIVPQTQLHRKYKVEITDVHETFAFGIAKEVL